MHDQNFKNLILDYPREALVFFAGEEAGNLEQAKITPIRQEQLQERLGERFRELDVPLLVEWPNGEREALLFAVEEESDSRRFSIHRLAHYCLDLSELVKTERIVPVVIFLQRGTHREQLQLGGDRHVYLDFRYLVCDLKRLTASDYRDSGNIVARLNLPNMNYPAVERLAIYAAAQAGLARLETDPERQLKYGDFIDYYADLNDQELAEYQQRYLAEEGELMGLTRTLIQQGVLQGVQQGMQQGEAAVLLRQLEKRFGAVPESVRTRIQTADAETLLHWSENILDAQTIEAVFH